MLRSIASRFFVFSFLVLITAWLPACDTLPPPSTAVSPPATAIVTLPGTLEPGEPPLPATASIAVYFTGDKTRAATLEEALERSIAAANRSIDVAMYNFNLDAAGEALLAAHRRGVRVRVLADSDALERRWFGRFRQAGIEVLGDGREELMHNKFLVIDEREVWSGSLNLTQAGTYDDDNNFVRILSTELARRYTDVFEAMFTLGEFGGDRQASGLDPSVDVVGVRVEVYFSPEDQAERRVVELVRGARSSILVLAYSFTSDPLARALLDQAGAGLEVRGVFDESQADGQGAEYAPLRQAGLNVRLDGSPGLMHNKVLILDHETVVLGSYNFTRAANQTNDENLLVIHDPGTAALYGQEFERIYNAGR